MKATNLHPSEYNIYYQRYIDLVADVSLVDALHAGLHSTVSFFEDLQEDQWNFRYAEGKWTPKDILQHISDTERVFAYRALYFSRARDADLKGFDENLFAENANAEYKSPEKLLKEYATVRATSICLFESFDCNTLKQQGRANGSVMSVAAAGFIICGHEIHHCKIISERYK